MSDFVHLHCHTEYSLLDGAIKLKDLCAKAKNFGLTATSITDHGNMYGVAYFYKTCKDFDIKPIIGCEVYTCKNMQDKTPETGTLRNHLILLAQNNEGYHNLIKLVTHAWLDGYYYKPRLDKKFLAGYSTGLICLSACLAGEIPRAISNNDMDLARNLVNEYKKLFPQRFYLELQANGLKEQELVNTRLLELAESENVPIVATNDCHYLNKGDAFSHEVLLCIQTQTTIEDPHRMKFDTTELYYKSPAEMEKDFSHIPQALANTAEIASLCNVELDFGHHYFPVYPLPEGESLGSEFQRLAWEGLKKRLAAHPDKDRLDEELYRERLAHEIKVIEDMGFPGYFLIVQEFINWAKNNNIPVGPGRGSAAGSLVAWALGITNLDPIPYNLLFERFLNIERISLPDIDVDFCERRRSEVIQHMIDTYGEKSVAQITTFGTMKAKGVVRDVGRALGMSYNETDRIAKLVPDAPKMTIDLAMQQEPELQKLYDNNESVKKLIDIAKRLEGLSRHASTHAAGLVVSDKPMEEYLPLYKGKRDELVTQFDGTMTEKTGLVKFDFLGLKTMTLIQDTLENIAQQNKPVPDLDNLPLNDPETYELYSRGDTDGVFQVESSGMKQYLRMLKPGCFEDIIAMLALYRPGPLGTGMVEKFIKCKHGQEPVIYPHESLQDCLADTYGVIVYQEQVMQIAQIIAGYTLGGADLLRRAMGKKKVEEMAKERPKFVDSATKNKIPANIANHIFDQMEKFAEYGFNKSHSAAYALISYYTAWLKVHYKLEFMAALLTSEMGNQDKLLKYIACCKDMDIIVSQPCVNLSMPKFVARGDKIVFGLGGIKNVGSEAIKSIIEARGSNNYKSFYDFLCKVNLRKITRRVIEALIKSGSCDCFGITRSALMTCTDVALARASKYLKNKASGQASLLGLAARAESENDSMGGLGFEFAEASIPEMEESLKMTYEKEALGFFLTSHPLQPYHKQLERLHITTLDSCELLMPGATINCGVLITNVKEIITKTKGERMAFVEVEDLSGHAEISFGPKVYPAVREFLQSDKPLFINAKLDNVQSAYGNEQEDTEKVNVIKLRGNSVRYLEDMCETSDQPVYIAIPKYKLNDSDLDDLKNILMNHPGNVLVEASLELENYTCRMRLGYRVKPNPELDSKLESWSRMAS